jgi:hypothetical protein
LKIFSVVVETMARSFLPTVVRLELLNNLSLVWHSDIIIACSLLKRGEWLPCSADVLPPQPSISHDDI